MMMLKENLLDTLQSLYPEGINSSEVAQLLKVNEKTLLLAAQALADSGAIKIRKVGKFIRLCATQGASGEQPKTASAPSKTKRNKPFTPNPTKGYRVEKGKVKIFLDRRASSRTLTLSVEDLQELVNAVKKLEC